MTEYRYPFFHWMTGLFLCAFGMVGLIIGVLIGIALAAA